MKEFIDKLIERLEEKEQILLDNAGDIGCTIGIVNAMECSKEIVNELAEEYKGKPSNEWEIIYNKVCNLENKYANSGDMENVNRCIKLENLLQYFKEELQSAGEYNNGWIPCDKELPKKEISIRVWLSFTNQYASFTRRAWWHNNHFEWDNGKVLKETPLAWKPCVAPAPYTEGE